MVFSLSRLFSRAEKHSKMPSGSLPFQSPQNRAGMPFNGMYNTPGVSYAPSLSSDFSFSPGTFGSGPTTPLDGSLLSPAQISYPPASGGLGSVDSSAYTQLLHQNRLLERELSKERQEHASLKYVPCITRMFLQCLLMYIGFHFKNSSTQTTSSAPQSP
jgi:hypothetical protein